MAAQTDERVDEMIVPKIRVWNIKEKQTHIQDRFHVEIMYGAQHDLDQWIGVKGEPENREQAKGYIKALVAPTEGITVNYPEEIHDLLINPTVLVKLEQQSKAVVMFPTSQRGELRILGCDTLSVTLALSTVEDLINKYLQEQTNESATSTFKAPSQQATKRLDSELRRLSSENGVVIISEDDYSDMNNAVKRTILGWLHENQEPETSQQQAEPTASTSAPDSPDVIIVNNDPDEPIPRETVSPGTNLSIMLHDTNFCTAGDSPIRESSLGSGKQLKPETITVDRIASVEETDMDSLSLTQNLLTSSAQEKGYSKREIQVVFEMHGRNLAASFFLQLLVLNRKLKADADQKLQEDVERNLQAEANRKLQAGANQTLQADVKSAVGAQSSYVESVGSSGAAQSPLARAAAVAQVQFGSGSVSPPTVSSTRTPPNALNGYLTQLQKDMTEEAHCECIDELKKKNVRRQRLLHEAYEKQTSSVKKPIHRKKHKKKSSGSSMSLSSSQATVAHGDDASDEVHDLTVNDSDSDIEFVGYFPSADDNSEATPKTNKPPAEMWQQSKGRASELDSFSLPYSANSTCVTTAQRNMLELRRTVSGEKNTHYTDIPHTTVSQELRGKASELDDFSLPFAVNKPTATPAPCDDTATGKADIDINVQIVDLTNSGEDISKPQSATPKQNGTISPGRNKCGTMPGPQLAKGSIKAVAASAAAVVTSITGRASKKMRYTPVTAPTVVPANPTSRPFMWQSQQEMRQQQLRQQQQLQWQQQRQQQLQQQRQQQRQQLQHLRQQPQKNQPVTGPSNMPARNQLRYIVIDGSNVAMAHGNDTVFSCKGIQLCIDYFRQRGHKEITAFVPQWRTQTAIRPDYPISDQYLLNKLKAEGVLVFTPCRRVQGKNIVCYDDRFHLRLAHTTDGVIVSNDNFRDLWNDNMEWRDVIENRLLMYSFVGDLFMVPDDPLGRNGPTLDELLTKPVPISYRCPQYTNMSVQPSQRPWFGNGLLQPPQQPGGGGIVASQQPQQCWLTQPPWQRDGRPLQPQAQQSCVSGSWPTITAASTQNKSRKTQQAQPKSNPRSAQDTARLTSQLKGVFPEHEETIRNILTNHPSEMDLNRLSGYVLEVAQ